MNGFKWELYNLADDPTQMNDLAAKEPDRLRMMQELFIMEATRNQVFPLNDSQLPMLTAERPGPAAGRTQFVYTAPMTSTQFARGAVHPQPLLPHHRGDRGAAGRRQRRAGDPGRPLLRLRPLSEGRQADLHHEPAQPRAAEVAGPEALPPGKHTIVFDWKMEPKGPPLGRGGTGTLSVDGKQVAQKSLPRTQPFTWAWDETFDVGLDTGTSGGRQGLPGAVRLHRQAGQDHRRPRRVDGDAGGHQDDDGRAGEAAGPLINP